MSPAGRGGAPETVAEGQPFYLDLISSPTSVAHGVPLGVEEATWESPEVWPLGGENRLRPR